jgi:alpha-N-arabinofuranosidase
LDLATFRSLRPRPRPGQQPAPDAAGAPGSVVRSDGPASTQIAVDLTRPLGSLDRNVFGGFIEHVGRCIYGGVYDEGSPLSDASGFRTDVLALLRELRLGVLRWPGGNFASNYHWQDGVGPAAARPRRTDLAWNLEESNRFGTDEFLAYCAELGTDPFICLNMGTGSLAEALAWIEYCNGAGQADWARQRRGNGHAEPYRVRYWALGNELYGKWQVGGMSAEEYVATATTWARAIRRLDPGAVLVSCGNNGWSDWDQTVINGLAPLVDLHSVHIYTGAGEYWPNVLAAHMAERAIRAASAMISRVAYVKKIPSPPRIAYDEWNVWYRTRDSMMDERYDVSDMLAVATYLNIFVRNCRWVAMANLAQLVNVIAPVVTTPDAAVTQPIYYPVLLHARGALDEAVDCHVTGPAVTGPAAEPRGRWLHRFADLGPFTVVDASATAAADRGKVAVTLVNRSEQDEPARLVLRGGTFGGPVQITVVTAERGPEQRTLPDVQAATITEGTEKPGGPVLELTLPARSFALVEGPVSP